MLLLSRSAIEARHRCSREFMWRYLYRGTGFSERVTPIHLALGIAHHKAMETLIRTAKVDGSEVELDIDAALKAAFEAWREERPSGRFPPAEPSEPEILALIEAFVRGWVRVEARPFFEEFEVISVEREAAPQPLSPSVSLQFRADVVVRSRVTGMLRVLNWKTSSAWGDWTDQWSSEAQAFSEAWALEKEAGEPVEGTQMIGFAKGGLRQTGGFAHFGSPLIWGYKRVLNGVTVYHADAKAPGSATPKWEKFPVWEENFGEIGSGIAAWIAWLPLHVLAASFMTSQVLRGHPKAVDSFINGAAQEAMNDHHVLTEGSERDKLLHFTPRMGKWQCGTAQKPSCAFWKVCFTDCEIDDLIEEGVLTPRVDHHDKVEPSAAV